MIAVFLLGGFEILFILFCILFGLAVMAFWIWMLVDCITNKGLRDGEKVGWALAIVFLHIIGSLLYLFIGHPKRNSPCIA